MITKRERIIRRTHVDVEGFMPWSYQGIPFTPELERDIIEYDGKRRRGEKTNIWKVLDKHIPYRQRIARVIVRYAEKMEKAAARLCQ